MGIGIYGGAHNQTVGGAGVGNVISGNGGVGVDLANAGTTSNVIKGNLIGLNAAGTAAVPNGGGGIRLDGGTANNTIGGAAAADRNFISGNSGPGVGLYNPGTSANLVQGNTIGVDQAGAGAVANQFFGVLIQESAGGNTLRSNLISGNNLGGVMIRHAGTDNNILDINRIGLNGAGSGVIPNQGHGVTIDEGAQSNKVGANSGYNVISGNAGDGVRITGANTHGNTVAFNAIGPNQAGSATLGNQGNGIAILAGASVNVIGGNIQLLPINFVVGNGGYGVLIEGSGTLSNGIFGSFIGAGTTAAGGFGNALGGVTVRNGSSDNLIGDNGPLGNLISGNNGPGVTIEGAFANQVQGNIIGLAASGTAALSNNGAGVLLKGGAGLNLVGGPTAAERNTISGNLLQGVDCSGTTSTTNTLQGNYIGLNTAGTTAIGNQADGVRITDGAAGAILGNVISGNVGNGIRLESTFRVEVAANRIGLAAAAESQLGNQLNGIQAHWVGTHTIGGTPADANVIAFNGQDGVHIFGTGVVRGQNSIRRVLVRCNSIFSNGALGINLGEDGVTPNDTNDVDVGPNELQNYPVITAFTGGAQPVVEGYLNSIPSKSYTLDFYGVPALESSGYGEGRIWLGSKFVTTDAAGYVHFNFTLTTPVNNAWNVTATATNDVNSTSEFSRGRANDAQDWLGYE